MIGALGRGSSLEATSTGGVGAFGEIRVNSWQKNPCTSVFIRCKKEGLLLKTTIEHHTIPINGIHLHLVECGDPQGEPLLLLHGFPEFWYGWHRQIDFLAEAGYRLLIPDQRGYHLSDKPAGARAYQIDTLAKDVIGILDARGIEKVLLIGHDWGGAVAWHVAMTYPERLKKLVNLNIPHPRIMVKTLKANREQRRRSWYIFFFQLPWLPEYMLRKNNYHNLRLTLQKTSAPGTFSEETLEQYLTAWQQPGALTAMLNWYRAAFRLLRGRKINPRITVPTLLIWGKQDKALTHLMAQPSIDLCDDGRLEMIEEASHWVQHEAPERVNELIGAFLRETSA